LQTIIAYNENEVREQKGFENLKSKDKALIDLIDPTYEVIKIVAAYFHPDQNAVELFRSNSKKPQIPARGLSTPL
jgi:hypothetical protein